MTTAPPPPPAPVQRLVVRLLGVGGGGADGSDGLTAPVPHGEDPATTAARLLTAVSAGPPDGDARLVLGGVGSTTAPDATGRPVQTVELRFLLPPGLADDLRTPRRRQRLAAYARVEHDGAVLLTRLSARTAAPGRWTLPGGGVGPGEDPEVAVVREVAEETSLVLRLGRLLGVDSARMVGRPPRRGPDAPVEDFHAVRLVWAGDVEALADPRVVEVDGTTDAAAWVPLDEATRLPLTRLAERFVPGPA